MSEIACLCTDQNTDRLDYAYSDASSHFFVACSYHRKESEVIGKIYKLTVRDDTLKLQSTGQFDYGILSQKIEEIQEEQVKISIGCSDGFLRTLNINFNTDEEVIEYHTISEIEVDNGKDIVLHHDSSKDNYACAMDSGNLHIFDRNTNESVFYQEKAHLYQMWYTMIDKEDSNVVYTAADDAKFKGWDIRTPYAPIFSLDHHKYGVCCIKPWKFDSNILITGSYDKTLNFYDRLSIVKYFDKRMFSSDIDSKIEISKSPVISKDIEKTIWDIKYSEENKSGQCIMGLSCVYDGFYFERINNQSKISKENNEIQFKNTEGLYYAMDFVPSSYVSNEDGSNSCRVVTVSFYDNTYSLKTIYC